MKISLWGHLWAMMVLIELALNLSAAQIDRSFNPQFPTNSGVGTFAIKPSGEILVGLFSSTTDTEERTRLVQLKEDGSPDPSFSSEARFKHLFKVLVQPDGKVLIVGLTLDEAEQVVRLLPNGEIDRTFNAPHVRAATEMALDGSGRIFVAGDFAEVDGHAGYYLARLLPDGTLDRSFVPATTRHGSAEGGMVRVAVQADQKVIMAGIFNSPAGKDHFARFNEDGSDDATFGNQDVRGPTFCNAVKVLPNGRILHGWGYRTESGIDAAVRAFLPTGARDPSYAHDLVIRGTVNSFDVQPDGKILAMIQGSPMHDQQLFRFHSNGRLDRSFGNGGGMTRMALS